MIKPVLILFITLGMFGCVMDTRVYKTSTKPYSVNGNTYHPMASVGNYSETGIASWYGPGFHGKKTASGDTYNQHAFTAAHKTLPFGTRLHVINLDNNRTTTVTVNDRGPFKSGRIIDLSRAAAQDIGMIGTGTARVRIQTNGYSPVSENVSGTSVKVNKTSVPKSVNVSGTYYVQVGAFSSKDNANSTAEKLSKSGYQKRIVAKGNMHVVQAGPYSTKNSATTARDNLRKIYSGAFVVE